MDYEAPIVNILQVNVRVTDSKGLTAEKNVVYFYRIFWCKYATDLSFKKEKMGKDKKFLSDLLHIISEILTDIFQKES